MFTGISGSKQVWSASITFWRISSGGWMPSRGPADSFFSTSLMSVRLLPRGARSLRRRDLALVLQGGSQRVPGERRALDPHGEFLDSRKHHELPERRLVGRRLLPRQQAVELLDQRL